MTAGDIFFGWVVPGLGLAFFAAGAWANASILFGGFRSECEAKAKGGHVSPIPVVAHGNSVMPSPPPVAPIKVLVRNAFFMCVVLAHGFRRVLPPY